MSFRIKKINEIKNGIKAAQNMNEKPIAKEKENKLESQNNQINKEK